jgi:alpha-methylacyl-CoA racemase
VETVLRIIEQADGLIEGFRPGVMERLGLGPDVCLERNPRLVYGRMTGWGQEGPYSQAAGHDINYIALAGCLAHIGRPGEAPVPPLNLVGDFGGGGMLLAFGLVCGLLEARESGVGQVVDAAMIDGAALLMGWTATLSNAGQWTERRGSNLLDGAAPNYTTYRTADGEYVAVGAMEPQFFQRLLDGLGLPSALAEDMADRSRWPALRERLAGAFATRTRAEWEQAFDGVDACVTPVLSLSEAAEHPHMRHRDVLPARPDGRQPAPAPRFARTPAAGPGRPTLPGDGGLQALAEWGVDPERTARLRDAGTVRGAES